jgi:enamine deaminase RidA (YjgF/YER057c/UK114 family)
MAKGNTMVDHHSLTASDGMLPTPPAPVGAYQAVVIRGGLGFVSGQFPLIDGEMRWTASHGETNVDTARAAARVAALNVIAQIRQALGSWDRFAGLFRVDGIIAAQMGFSCHATILDAASETFVEFFGPERGAHARSAISCPGLPRDAAIELVVTFAVADEDTPEQLEG